MVVSCSVTSRWTIVSSAGGMPIIDIIERPGTWLQSWLRNSAHFPARIVANSPAMTGATCRSAYRRILAGERACIAVHPVVLAALHRHKVAPALDLQCIGIDARIIMREQRLVQKHLAALCIAYDQPSADIPIPDHVALFAETVEIVERQTPGCIE